MDDALRLVPQRNDGKLQSVLILVLMDDALRLNHILSHPEAVMS